MMVPVTKAIYDAIMEIRESGSTNMFDQRQVLRLLNDADEAEAWLWVYNHKAEYARAIREGFDVDGQGDPRLSAVRTKGGADG